MAETKPANDTVERVATTEEADQMRKDGMPVMRSRADELSIWQSVRRNKVLGLIAMSAAFSAALDGYRKHYFHYPCIITCMANSIVQRST